ncbi:hypothetical protein P4318_15240 [Bacillus tropicus]|nr:MULTISPECIES: hypothetical protein [Bacillus cereus group]MED2901040.1 hypothetical protein [Bacillus tropicus]
MVQNKVTPEMLDEVANRAINSTITLKTYESRASKRAIQELQKFSSIDVPLDYLEVIQHCTNAEIHVKNEL